MSAVRRRLSTSITPLMREAISAHASRWALDSVEANAFVDDFYHSLLSGQPVSNATRLTSQKMLLNPRTAHPYYWAAFAAYGRP